MTRVLICAMLVATLPGAARAQHDGYRAPIAPTARMLRQQRVDALNDIRREGLEQRAADGGNLTAPHREAIQRKIDDAEARYASQMHRYEFSRVERTW